MTDIIDSSADASEANPTLNISDIQNAVRVIDFAADQGAFRGWGVIEQVLMVRNRMNDFLTAVAPAPAPEADKAVTETDAA